MVLPILLEDVELPGFLKGKFYGDFRRDDAYEETFQRLLAALGPAEPPPKINEEELEILRRELKQAKRIIEHHTRDQQRRSIAISSNWGPKLRAAVDAANREFPHHKTVNEAYAFEVGNTPVTLDYMLWAIAKVHQRGAHQLELLLTLDNKWQEAQLMLEAYSDYMSLENGNG